MKNSLIAYFQFFTRLVIPIELEHPLQDLKKGSQFLPLFGCLIGAIEGILYWVSQLIFPPMISLWIVLVFDSLFTGGMHQDGLADMADGLFSSRKKERMVEIMKDSRIGTMGALALIFYYGFMLAIVSSYSPLFQGIQGALLIFSMHVVAKSHLTLLFHKMIYAGANSKGLGKTWEGVSFREILFAQGITIFIVGALFQWKGLVSYLIGVLVTLIYRQFVYQKISGMNGDTLGAIAPISFVVFLLSMCSLGGM